MNNDSPKPAVHILGEGEKIVIDPYIGSHVRGPDGTLVEGTFQPWGSSSPETRNGDDSIPTPHAIDVGGAAMPDVQVVPVRVDR